MNMTAPLALALHNVTSAAEKAKQSASTLEALQTLLKVANSDHATLDVESLAKLLLTFDLCLVHRAVVSQAIELVKQTDDGDGLSSDALTALQERLQLAHDGVAQRGAV